jgi:hypothetical protein
VNEKYTAEMSGYTKKTAMPISAGARNDSTVACCRTRTASGFPAMVSRPAS